VAVSRAIYEKFLVVFPDLVTFIRIIPNGIETARYQLESPGEKIKQELGMEPEDPLITTIGTLSPVKNQAMLIKAVAQVVSVYPKLRLIIVGEGPLKKELVALQEEMGLKQQLRFLGLRKDIPEILAGTDIFVSTSLYEGLPLSILEAMAAGKPVVATAVPGTLEVLEDGSGLLIPLDSQADLAQTLKRLIEEPEQRKVLGKKAQERVSHHYSLEGYVLSWQSLYEELMRGMFICPIK
jgi:glycosyltransferase involved in cell wall biosynthesis